MVIPVAYTATAPCSDGVTGLGLRVHWSSSALAFDGIGDVLTVGLVAQGNVEADSENADNDPATDRRLVVAWADLDGHWPDHGCQAALLLTLHFTTQPQFAGSAAVNFSAASAAAGYTLSATGARINFTGDSDGDGLSDARDPDDDNDGLDDTLDTFPLDPARPGGVQRIALEPGLNLFAYTLAVAPAHANCYSLFTTLGGPQILQSLARFNPQTGVFEHCEDGGGIDFGIASADAYVAVARQTHTQVLNGAATCADAPLQSGVNPRGHPSPTLGLTCYRWLAELGEDTVTAIRRHDPATARFETCAFAGVPGKRAPVGVDFPVWPGWGYLLYSPAGGPITTTCGD